MKNRYLIFCLLWIVLTGCGATRAIYGVPEVQWARMNETERQATIDYFKQQQEINAVTRIQAEKAKTEAEEFASQCHDAETYQHPSEKCEVIQHHRWLFQKENH
ncbi:secreted protein [Beggiatoa sp. PS]|nr:secreted protein [Beggiatoa sp. PS]